MTDNERVEFEGRDGTTLVGRLHRPFGESRTWALFAHCFTCSKDLRAAYRISESLAERGIATLRFDFTGIGESEGDFADTNFSSNVEDLVAAADMMRERYSAPSILVGHSLGGAAVIAAAARVDECRAVATIGAPCDPGHVAGLLRDDRERIRREGKAEVELEGRRFTIKRQFLDDLEDQHQADRIRSLGRALLIMHSPRDTVVDIENARRLFDNAMHPKSFISLDGADHLLSRPADAEYAAHVLSAWARRYVPKPDSEPEPGDWLVVRNRAGALTSEIGARGHEWLADEPADVPEGHDRGPTPYDLLLGSLGACTAMTLRMYARHKELDLEDVTVRLSHERVHARDCEECETAEGRIDRIEREIAVTGNLTDDQRRRLIEIAEKCPVHRTLTSETRIVTRSVDG